MSRPRPTRIPDLEADAARALGFVNTLYPRPLATAVDKLPTYQALVEWGRAERAITARAADRLLAAGQKHPGQASAALARARELRETLHALLTALEAGRAPAPSHLEALGRWLADACAHGRLVPHEGRLHWTADGEEALDAVAWSVARAAGTLVTSDRLARVRTCAADDCGWLFLDDTRNRSRRWCDMKTCGNRAKLRRFRERNA